MASASNENEYQGYFLRGKGGRYLGLATLSTSCSACLEILGGAVRVYTGTVLVYLFTLFHVKSYFVLPNLYTKGKY